MFDLSSIEEGKQRLQELNRNANIVQLTRLVQKTKPNDTCFFYKSPDSKIEAYFDFIRSTPIIYLSSIDRDIVENAADLCGFGIMAEYDKRLCLENETTEVLNFANNLNLGHPLLGPERWYSKSGYDFLRDNYRFLGLKCPLNSMKRIETYSRKKAINNKLYGWFLLRHLWEEVALNKTKLKIINTDENHDQTLLDIDYHVINTRSGNKLLFKHSNGHLRFENPHGICDHVIVNRHIEKFKCLWASYFTRTIKSVMDLRELCIEWKGGGSGFLREFDFWEKTRKLDVISHIPIQRIISQTSSNILQFKPASNSFQKNNVANLQRAEVIELTERINRIESDKDAKVDEILKKIATIPPWEKGNGR